MKLKHLILIGLCALCNVASVPATITNYVSLDSASPSAPFLTWDTAANTISAAVSVATSGNLVLVSNGLYAITSEILVANDITIRGLGGAENVIVTRTDPAVTTRLFRVTAAGAVLDSLTLSNGLCNGRSPGSNNRGAGVRLDRGTLTHCVITHNRWATTAGLDTTFGGGASVGTGAVLNCTFQHNDAFVDGASYNSGSGGGLYVVSGLVANCTIGPTNRAAQGGNLNIVSGTVSNCLIFEANGQTSGKTGGGIYFSGSAIVIESCILSNNQGASGGNLSASGYSPTIRNCEIIAGYDSSVQLLNSSALVENCRFHHTSSPWRSAVILSTNVTLRNCLFYANTTGDKSAALFMNGGRAENCTITANQYTAATSPGAGGVIVTNALLLNCIVFSNKVNSYSAGLRHHDLIALTDAILSNNCARDVTQGEAGNITQDPKLKVYAAGYGTTAVGGDFHLNPNTSPCFNTGLAQSWMASATDLDGYPRAYHNRVNMGAFQYFMQATVYSMR